MLVGLAALPLGAVVACSAPTPGGMTVAAEAGYKFNPARITATAGQPVTVTLDNKDSIAHDWKVEGVTGAETGEVNARGKKTITFTAPARGTYTIVCTLPGHLEAGMKGELVVN